MVDAKERDELVLQRLKEGKSTTEIAEEFASKGIKDSKGEPVKRKTINNILTRLKLKKNTIENESGVKMRKQDGCIFTMGDKWIYRKTYQGNLLVNKSFKTEKEALAFQKEFMEKFNKEKAQAEPQLEMFPQETENTGKGGKRKGAGRPPKEKGQTPKPQLQQFSQKDIPGNDSGFVVIMGKDTNVLKQILTQFEM